MNRIIHRCFFILASLALYHNSLSAACPEYCQALEFSIEGEFLWWRAEMDNLDYGYEAGTTVSLAPPIIINSKLREPDFKFDPGVRVSAGYHSSNSRWDLFARWTYHNTDASDHAGNPDISGTILPTKALISESGVFVITSADSGKIRWQNRLNMFDLELGYSACSNLCFSFRPFAGIKGVWLKMSARIDYENVVGPSSSFDFVHFDNETDFWGMGPLVGFESKLLLGKGVSLYGKSSAAFVGGSYDLHFKQTTSVGGDISAQHKDFSRQRAIGAASIGLEWCCNLCRDQLLTLHLGWEGQCFWNQNQFRFGKDSTYHGDLTYSGLDAGIAYSF